jgi:hypothetical protein
VDSSLLLKQDSINWLYGDSSAKNTISTGDGILTIAMPDTVGGDAFTTVIKVNGPYITGEEGHATFYRKVNMNNNLDVSGTINMGGMSVLTTDTSYTKAAVDDLLLLQEPKFITVAPLLKNLNFETGTIDLILSEAFLSNIDGKVDQSYVDDALATKANTADLSLLYQPKLSNESSIGYSVLGPDDKTVYSLEASSGIYLLPTYTMVDNVPSDYRIQIKVDELYTAQAQAYTNNAIAAIELNPCWVSGKVNGATLDKVSRGRVPFNVSRVSVGIYEITFASHPLGPHYTISLTGGSHNQNVRETAGFIPTSTKLQVVMTNASNIAEDALFYFAILHNQ